METGTLSSNFTGLGHTDRVGTSETPGCFDVRSGRGYPDKTEDSYGPVSDVVHRGRREVYGKHLYVPCEILTEVPEDDVT